MGVASLQLPFPQLEVARDCCPLLGAVEGSRSMSTPASRYSPPNCSRFNPFSPEHLHLSIFTCCIIKTHHFRRGTLENVFLENVFQSITEKLLFVKMFDGEISPLPLV